MSKIVISSSSNSVDKVIDKYHNSTSYSGSSSNISNSSSGGNTTDEEYTFGVPRVPSEALQEQLRTRTASGSQASTLASAPPFTPLNEVKTVYICVVGIPSKTTEQRLNSLRTWYQIPNDLNLRLAVRGEWCSNPILG